MSAGYSHLLSRILWRTKDADQDIAVSDLAATLAAYRQDHPVEALDVECRFLRNTLAIIAGRGDGADAQLAELALQVTSGDPA